MKKLYLELISAIAMRGAAGKKAVSLLLLAFTLSSMSYTGLAQVVVTPASGGTSICHNTALGGSAPTCTTLGPITVTETANSDFSIGSDQIILTPPAGWQFCVGSVPVLTHTPGGDILGVGAGGFSSSSFTINVNSSGVTLHDAITITGLAVQALTTASLPGSITASSVSGVTGIAIAGSPTPTDFGDLTLLPGVITGPSTVCQNDTITLTSVPGPVTWTASSGSVALFAVVPASTTSIWVKGITPSVSPVVITATDAGCTTTFNVVVNPNPSPITGLLPVGGPYRMCEFVDSLGPISSSPAGGLYNSSLIFVVNLGGGTAEVYSSGVGTGTIQYTLPTGCFVTATVIDDPVPGPIKSPPYEVCQGLTKLLTDTTVGGTWSTVPTSIGTIDPSTGLFYGVAAGTTLVTYTIPGGHAGGCITDTIMTVKPLPAPIAEVNGTAEECLGNSFRLADATPGGTWSGLPTGIVVITPTIPDTVLITGSTAGTTTISYTGSNGCVQSLAVTVDPLPDSISGPTAVCVNDSVQLLDPTPGGTWTSGSLTVATVNASTGYVTGVSAGVALITYSINPGNCIVTYLVTVNGLPGVITGPDSVCVGAPPITLVDTPAGGTWTNSVVPPITFVDPVSPGLITGLSSGVDTIFYTLSTGCRASFLLTVNPMAPPISGLDSICFGPGDSTLLTDITTTGGVWTSSTAGVVSILSQFPDSAWVAGVGVGTSTIYYTLPTGCKSPPFVITVNAFPSPIVGDTEVCIGTPDFLTDALPGGTWVVFSGVGTPTATIGATTGILNGISQGTVIVSYFGPGGCATELVVHINPNDTIIGLTHQLCQDQSESLSNDQPSGTINWTSSNSAIVSVIPVGTSTPPDVTTATALSPGVAIITYTNSYGCPSTFTITVNPVAPIGVTGSPAVCVGSSFLVSESVTGGTWGSTNTAIATVTPLSLIPPKADVTGVSAGICEITYSLPTGCSSFIEVTVNPLPGPIYGKDSVCMGDTIQLSDSNTLLVGSWSVTNGNATIVPGTGVLTGQHAGYDTVIFTVATGCSDSLVIKVNLLNQITGPNNVCVNSEITVQDTTHGTIGVWSVFHHGVIDSIVNTAPVIPAGSSATDSGISAGVDTIAYHISTSGCTAYYRVTVNPLPTVTGIFHVCVGSSIVDTGHTPGGSWLPTNGHATITPHADDSTATIHGVTVGFDTITYKLITGCTTTFIVRVDSTPNRILGDTTLCYGRSELLTDATIGGSWSSKDTNIIFIDTTTHIIYGDSVGRDTIFYTLPIGTCSSFIVVTVEPIPVIGDSQSHPTMICIGGSSTLYAYGAGLGGTYTWSPSFGLSSTVGSPVIASPTVTTTYTVTGTSKYGCDSFNTITVIVDDTFLHIKVIGRDSICRGQCDTLMASGRAGTYFNWHPVTSLNCTICDTTIACPDTTTTYTGIAIDDIGCKDSVVFKITVNPLPIVVVTPNPAILCFGTPLQLHATTTNTDNSTTTFAWSPNLFISDDSVYNPIVNDTTNLVYKVIATTIYGCQDSFKEKVSVLDTNVNSISLDTNICLGGSAQLFVFSHSVTSNLDVPVYTWSPDTAINDPFIWDPVVTPSITTTYSVHVIENQCFDTTMKVTVFVQPYPQITITPQSETIVAGSPIQLYASVTNTPVLSYMWTPATGTCDSCLNPVVTPTANTTYTVVVSSIYHCIDQDTVTLLMLCDNSQIFIPNTFTPNGDGINDRFFVSGKGISMITLMQVYNRWGQLVFEAHNIPANNPGYGWDGTFKGLVLEPDVFVYIVHAQCELGGNEFKYKGDISIVR